MPVNPRSRRSSIGWFLAGLCAAAAACGGDGGRGGAAAPRGWTTYGGSQQRTFFNAHETQITAATVDRLRRKWRYLTGAVVTASPTIAYLDVAGEGQVKAVIIPSWDGNLYALRAANGSRLWHFTMKPHPGASFPYASSAEVTVVDGEQRIYVGGGMTVYCLAAGTGELIWEFDAGSGCTTCDSDTERNEVLSSPTVYRGLVFFGMDVDDREGGKGGLYAVDARQGHLVWFLDLQSESVCRPRSSDRIRRFDGYQSAAALGLPPDFFSTRPGCDFDRTGTGCGNVWSTFAVDPKRDLLYIASSNCDTDDDPRSIKPGPQMPRLDEALIAITPAGEVAWSWRPREVDNDDLAFGGAPNLFEVEIGGRVREVVGVGNKDGTYYLLDRDGINEITGRIEPYWQTKVVPGGAIGGIIASAAVGDGSIFFSTAIGFSVDNPQRPSAWALDAGSGAVRWSNRMAPPSFGPTTAVPGVAFMGGLLGFLGGVQAYDASNGALLHRLLLDGPVSSPAIAFDGELFVGEGTGARGGSPAEAAFLSSIIPSHVTAYCLSGAPDCPGDLCDDGQRCTYDFHTDSGCRSEPVPDGVTCDASGAGDLDGVCRLGVCVPAMPAGAAGPLAGSDRATVPGLRSRQESSA